MEELENRGLFGAAGKLLGFPAVRWALRGLLAVAVTWITTAVWPDTRAWIRTRAGAPAVAALDARVVVLEGARQIDYARLSTSDTLTLTDREQVQWLVIHIGALQGDLAREVRARLALEVLLLYANPRSATARRMASVAKARFDVYTAAGDAPETAERKTLEFVYENLQ